MIARTILKASTNQINDWPTDQTNQSIKPIIDRLRSTNQVIKNNGLHGRRLWQKPKLIEKQLIKWLQWLPILQIVLDEV